MRSRLALIVAGTLGLIALGFTAAVLTQQYWRPWLFPDKKEEKKAHADEGDHVQVSEQAQKALGLDVRKLKLTSHPITVELPGQVVELPGHSDRIITAPVTGVVQHVSHVPGQVVRPGERLFTLKLVSESLQNIQVSLFKARRELEFTRKQKQMLTGSAPAVRLMELELQEQRQEAAIQSHTFELESRGFTKKDVEKVGRGEFLTTLDVRAPDDVHAPGTTVPAEHSHVLEIQEMKVHPGEQVEAGQVLCTMAHHEHLGIEGHAFRQELPHVERVVEQRLEVRALWPEEGKTWKTPEKKLQVRNIGNVADATSQTFPFYLPLVNEYQSYEKDGRSYRLWRYRPGQRVRLQLPAGLLEGVFVLPRAGVVREGVENYVFRQNGDVFERLPVQVVYEDRSHVVLKNDGSVQEGWHIAHNAAAALNRALKTRKTGENGHDHGHAHPH